MKLYAYRCLSSTCGQVEISKYAPAATKKCPSCGGTMVREAA